ncbi:MAG: DEAD/DEAH box helicase, partial [Clostridia bacterium]|nr:DEAD/DEAH box helicase [Clostridia bacterium]
MTEADRIFEKFPPFIKEYIYSHSWDTLRDVQLFAADIIFNTDENLLLTSSTASGKTEAAFFPILTDIWNRPSKGISVLYIAPLISLINDQFYR